MVMVRLLSPAARCLLGHFPSFRVSRAVHPQEFFEDGCRTLTHASLGFSVHFRFFLSFFKNFCSMRCDLHKLGRVGYNYSDVEGMKKSNWMVLVDLPRKTDCNMVSVNALNTMPHAMCRSIFYLALGSR